MSGGQGMSVRAIWTLVAATALLAACEREVILPGERFAVRTPLEDSVPVEGEALPVAARG